MRTKIAIFHPQLICGGGSEACPLYLADTLKHNHDVTLVSLGKVDLTELNAYYGTNIKPAEVTIVSLPIFWLFKKRFDALRAYSLARFAKKQALQFDVMISTYNVMDFGKRGIQFIADFSFDDNLRRKFDGGYKDSPLRRLYLFFGTVLSGASREGWKKNLTVANSEWTKGIIQESFGVNSIVIYPPVVGNFSKTSWEEKENGVVFLGRISPEKQIEKIIRIVGEVRKQIAGISLHIVGPKDDSAYAHHIEKLCKENSGWCFFEGKMYGQKKLDFIAKYKYGISARTNEPFGIAVAEMAKSGSLVFVPDGGGQTEIVNSPDLTFHNEADAIAKMVALMKNSAQQMSIQKALAENVAKFSREAFEDQINQIMLEFHAK